MVKVLWWNVTCRRSSLDWQLPGSMSRRVSGPTVNFSSRVSGLGLAEADGGVQTYHAPLSQTFTAVDFDMQVGVSFLQLSLVVVAISPSGSAYMGR